MYTSIMTLPRISKEGFTLIELLIVITIIAILLGAISFSYNAAQRKGRDGKRKADLKQVQQALEQYFNLNGSYPPASSGKITCDSTNYTSGGPFNWGSDFRCVIVPNIDEHVFLASLPVDPDPAKSYYYDAPGSYPFFTYSLQAQLENPNDPDLVTGPPPSCTLSGLNNYCVVNP